MDPAWTDLPALALRTLGEDRKKSESDDRFDERVFHVLQLRRR
jgi:hypothetical protein